MRRTIVVHHMLYALVVLAVAGFLFGGCAPHPAPAPPVPPSPTVPSDQQAQEPTTQQKLFAVALKTGVQHETKNLVAWHPDLVPYLRQWLDALCDVAIEETDTAGLKAVLLGTLQQLTIPDEYRQMLVAFVPLVVNAVPFAMGVLEGMVPEAGAVLVTVKIICRYIEQALPPVPAGA